MRVEVAGAGVAGLAVAAGLASKGWEVVVHEAASEIRPSGGGLYISSFGLQALDALGLREKFLPRAYAPVNFETWLNGERKSFNRNFGQFYTTLRQNLHDVLTESCRSNGVTIVTGSKVAKVDPEGLLKTDGGDRLDADLIVAADGVASKAYADLGFSRDRVLHDDGLVRVLIDRSGLAGDGWDSCRDFWSFGAESLRILYTPCSETHCYLVMMAPLTDQARLTLPIDVSLWTGRFPLLAPLLERISGPARVDRYSTVRIPGWHAGKVVIVGDAAHAMPSSHGRGANLALYSATALVRTVADGSDVQSALAAWEMTMRPVVADAQAEAELIASARSLKKGVPDVDIDKLVPKSLQSA